VPRLGEREEHGPRHQERREQAHDDGRTAEERPQTERQEMASREGLQHVEHRPDRALRGRVDEVNGAPAGGPEPRLERPQALEVEEHRPRRARQPQCRDNLPGQRREPERHHRRGLALGTRSRIPHGVVHQQLGGAVGRVRRTDEVLEQPPGAGEDRCRGEEPHESAVLLGQVHAVLVEQGERIHLDQEAHRGHLAPREPLGDQRLELSAERRRARDQLVVSGGPDGDALRPGAPQLLP
jgi:hypothetical protein